MPRLPALAATIALATASTGFVSMPVEKMAAPHKISKKRAIPVSGPAQNLQWEYMTILEIGNPPQKVNVSIDTDSSDLWVYNSESAATHYNPSKSDTSEFVSGSFTIFYADGTLASGDYWKDNITWGDAVVNCQFGVDTSYDAGTPHGTFGIGFNDLQALLTDYPNYPYALKDAGIINAVTYSIAFGPINDTNGELVFGAIDKSRYVGDLAVQDLYLWENSEEIQHRLNYTILGDKVAGFIDTGTSYTTLPSDTLKKVAESFGSTEYNASYELWKAPDPIPDRGLEFNFKGVNVTVPPSELWREIVIGNDDKWLTIFPSSFEGGMVVLGDSFLRSAYVVYDLEYSKVGIAQANFNPGESDYQVIPSGGIAAL